MGLPELQIDFEEEIPDHCAYIESSIWLDRGGIVRIAGVVYSLSPTCARLWSAKELALHETLHWRLQHPYQNLSDAEKHREVEKFAPYYR
jgi:hypothetical protein